MQMETRSSAAQIEGVEEQERKGWKFVDRRRRQAARAEAR